MQHWVIDRHGQILETWKDALPGVRLVQSGSSPCADEAAIYWFRLRADEQVEEVLAGVAETVRNPFVVLADEPDERVVMESLAAGAAGCCNSRAAVEVLQQVALVVANGGLWIGQALLQQLVGSTARIMQQRSGTVLAEWRQKLSEREQEVALGVAAGASNKEVAERLGITERTVKAHLTAAFDKLGIRDRLQLSLLVNGMPL